MQLIAQTFQIPVVANLIATQYLISETTILLQTSNNIFMCNQIQYTNISSQNWLALYLHRDHWFTKQSTARLIKFKESLIL